MKVERQMFFNELNSDQEYYKLKPYAFFNDSDGIYLEKYVVLPNIDSPCSIESIYNVPHPKIMVK